MTDDADMAEVRLLALDLAELHDAEAHHDELFREFALIAAADPSPGHELPGQLVTLIDELTARFAVFASGPQDELAAAAERGDQEVDVSYRVPRGVAEAVTRLAELLTAADDYCRNGDLLTLAPPPEAVTFRNWYLGEFVAQCRGSDPTPWPEYRARALDMA
ncbi:MAG: hypothetical protein M3011_07645 [Actinomycetota bacterium]|nr:hypothetical protein [Actinomycetota bacterium]